MAGVQRPHLDRWGAEGGSRWGDGVGTGGGPGKGAGRGEGASAWWGGGVRGRVGGWGTGAAGRGRLPLLGVRGSSWLCGSGTNEGTDVSSSISPVSTTCNQFTDSTLSHTAHPDHILINNGISATNFEGHVHNNCLERKLPQRPDLVILEHLPYMGTASPQRQLLFLEQLINRLQYNFNLSSFPPMIFLNMYAILEPNYTAKRGKAARDDVYQCVWNGTLCPSLCPDNLVGMPFAGSDASSGENITNSIAAHYGATSLSYANLMTALMHSSARGNLSECQVFATVFRDPTHPNRHGEVLLADLLVNYLAGAHKHFHSKQKRAASTLSHDDYPREHPGITPLNPRSLMVPWMRCFGTKHAMYEGEGMAPHDLNTTSEIDVVRAEGWAYVQTDNGQPKPGWVSNIPGSALWMAIDTDFGKLAGPHLISLTVLSSYQHMGRAEVTCISGCRCDNKTIDCHVPNHRHSIPKQLEFHFFQKHHHGQRASDHGNLSGSSGNSSRNSSSSTASSSRCIIQLKVLQESSSGEHKVKVMQLAIKAMVNVSDALPHANI